MSMKPDHSETTLYQDIIAAGIEHDSHESDLYVPMTPAVNRILAHHNISHFRTFRCERSGDLWVDIPFQFDPWWESKGKKPFSKQ